MALVAMKRWILICVCVGVARGKVIDIERFVEDQDTSSPGFCCIGKDDGIYPDPNDCGGFIQCANDWIFFQKCPYGTKFNSKGKYCDWPENVTCPKFCASRPDGIYADPETCEGFIYCHNNRTSHMACPGGLLFNPKLKVCDWPRNVDCPTGPGGSGDFY